VTVVLTVYTSDVRAVDPKKKASVLSLLMRLDEVSAPGLPEDLFADLFLKCRKCGYTMTKRVFHHHTCLAVHPASSQTFIDLTLDDSDSETEA
jgi:hypothetical protein